jgi:WD40 repeat protein
VAFSPDGEIIVTGSADQKAHRWRTSTGELLGTPLQHDGDVTAVTFSRDGRMILTGSTDQTARLWDAATGSPLGPPFYHRAPVAAVAFSPDGKRVLTGSLDGTARLWDVPFPLSGRVKRIALWTQVLTGMELDQQGAARMLDAGEWQERRRQLEELGGPPLP